MKDKLGLISGIVLFASILIGMIYLIAVKGDDADYEKISVIKISNNHLLSANDYLNRTGLSSKNLNKGLTLQVIKTKIEKHPYIQKAEVQSNGNGEVLVKIIEKEMKAVIIKESEANLITEGFEFIKLEDNSEISELPVITNANEIDKNENSLQNAFKIIDASLLANQSMHKKLAEVNLRNGGEIKLRFSGIKFPVLFGKGNIAKKVVELSSIWDKIIKNKKPFKNIDYIDLRFNNEIIIGNPTAELNG